MHGIKIENFVKSILEWTTPIGGCEWFDLC